MWTRAAQVARILFILLGLSVLRFALPWPDRDSGAFALPAIGDSTATSSADVLLFSRPRALSAVPRATAEFLAAYARGDEATADQLASPLYRAEWERRGLSAAARTWIDWPNHRQGEPFPERLRFTFAGGIVDDLGFGHLLFASRPALPDRPTTPSVFRVDADATGHVIWLELVWHFGDDVGDVRPELDTAELARVPLPSASCCASLLFGLAATSGSEGYYAYSLDGQGTPSPELSQRPRPTIVRFFAVDSDRLVRPDAWSYGKAPAGLLEYGKRQPVRTAPQLDARDAALLRYYLATLG